MLHFCNSKVLIQSYICYFLVYILIGFVKKGVKIQELYILSGEK